MTTLSDLSDACDNCGERAAFTGRTREADARVFAILRCPSCEVDIPVWSREHDAMVRAWAADPLPEAAMLPLRGEDADAIAGYLFDPPERVPCWGIRDVAVSAGDPARWWCELVLGHPGLFPPPSHAARLEEVLAAAIWFEDEALAALAAECMEPLTGREAEALLMHLPARAARGGGAAVRPFVAALREAGGELAAAVAVAERRWVIPGLRAALAP